MLDSIFKSGQTSDITKILSRYNAETIIAIDKVNDAVAALIRDYGDDGVKVAVKGGADLVKAINNLDDDAAELRIAVEYCLEQLRILYPDYNFSAVYGG